ncbi:energy-coupling factor ABC transporter ATP-binding protein [Herbaspirillum sp. NPDC101397]|uniref:energy-coupling factor ABC transporter ATP-binding protein n=1 Tax=Herbaspirillum sp. NPDC101397 TaxID=3364006 RepID=UPI00383B2780
MTLKTLPLAGAATPGIRLESVTLARGDRVVLEQIDLHLTEQRIGLVGDNGAGKSSLFRLICGLDQPQSGRVSVHGCRTDEASERRKLPQHVGLMFQNPDDQIIFPTVAEELAFSLTAAGIGKPQARQQARAFLAARGLPDWADRAVGELSQGQRQQVCLMALQITTPATLLLDEPYSALDLPSQLRLSAQIAATSQQIILSTHLLEHVQDFERVLWLEQGKLRGDGPGRDVCAAYARDVRERAVLNSTAEVLQEVLQHAAQADAT